MMTTLSVSEARQITLRAQRLDGGRSLAGMDGAAQVIDQLGYVQIDSIAVVERAHHHTLWGRCDGYRPEVLDLLMADRRVFEYWAHALALLPISDYRFYVPRMQQQRDGRRGWLRPWRDEHGELIDQVLNRIRSEGPLASKDFAPPEGATSRTWWDWKPAKTALEVLFWQGDLMISRRDGFQKLYDLTERVLPAETNTRPPSPEELGRFHVRRALRGLGLATEREIKTLFHLSDLAQIRRTLHLLQEEREVVAVQIEGAPGTNYALAAAIEPPASPTLRIARVLSPFDNLVILRDRLERLFGFEYTIECYLPAGKRRYGYFVLPVLWGTEMIGRLDAKADRKEGRLLVKGFWFEPSFSSFDAVLPSLAEELARFARFNGSKSVEMGLIHPGGQ
ncbi:MAG TPA: winged helix-turn-helix domain-containing protein, partial [Candidatus Acetothermia bacterium]|nr:winged helix-turn-helix domain-containing protein [Candidatus Acetothermia bacterium]